MFCAGAAWLPVQIATQVFPFFNIALPGLIRGARQRSDQCIKPWSVFPFHRHTNNALNHYLVAFSEPSGECT
jgi:hypothetical protein